MYNTKLQGRSRIHRTHNYTWHRRQKQLNPIVTVGNKITKAVRSDKAEFRTRKTRPQPVPMSDIRGLRQQVWKEPGLLDVRYKTPASRDIKAKYWKGNRIFCPFPYNMCAFSFCTCWLDLFYHLFVPQIKMSLFIKNKIVLNQQKRVTEIGIWNASSV